MFLQILYYVYISNQPPTQHTVSQMAMRAKADDPDVIVIDADLDVVVVIDAPQKPQQLNSCTLRIDLPLKAQQNELNAAARKKLLGVKQEAIDMQKEWKAKIVTKMTEIEAKEMQINANKLFELYGTPIKDSMKKRPRSESMKWWFEPDFYDSVTKNSDFARRCIEEIRADAKASGEVLPWRECMPIGILGSKLLKEYVEAWIAEEP